MQITWYLQQFSDQICREIAGCSVSKVFLNLAWYIHRSESKVKSWKKVSQGIEGDSAFVVQKTRGCSNSDLLL
jgi:hypothetical protein